MVDPTTIAPDCISLANAKFRVIVKKKKKPQTMLDNAEDAATHHHDGYWRAIVLMVVLSFVVSYVVLSNVMLLGPVFNHLNKVYMALLMSSTMALIAAVSMPPRKTSDFVVLIVISTLVSLVLIVLIRRQVGIGKEEFSKSMHEHHQAGILMAQRVLEHTDNEAVRQLAHNIIRTQQREIDQMGSWLRHGFPPNSTSTPSTSRRAGTNDSGFAQQMADIMHRMHMAMQQIPSTGQPDTDFLAQMLPHHQAGVDMARLILVYSQNPAVLQLAQDIVAKQSAEIAQMQHMLRDLNASAMVMPAGPMSGPAHFQHQM